MWSSEVTSYVEEFLRLEGLGDARNQCTCARPSCATPVNSSVAGYRCRDCQDFSLFCAECLVLNHAAMPLHRVEVCFPSCLSMMFSTLPLEMELNFF